MAVLEKLFANTACYPISILKTTIPCIPFLKKRYAKKLSGFFEKKPRQKTLVGCAANSGAGAVNLIYAASPLF
ncbi:hypothetical protein D3Z39_16185 [Anaerotruncus colihominis]|uniref:Uncharacterized protein n=1 Tax=Anaerotruncus colihominis TaxID=169435 RepID=A0A845RNA3_9FIRM|nr:hypothetical protein [Anaerotruncus colihominis]